MEQKDIDIYDILKDVPKGTEFYTSLCGNVGFSYLETNKEAGEAIWTENKDGEYSFNKNGRWMEGGEVLLFPSKELRDWSKFFKKGDVLVHRNGDVHVIFEGFKDNRYTRFKGKHYLWKERFEDYNKEVSEMITFMFRKASDDEAQTYINTLEKHFGGKLNLETLEIEKDQPEFKDGDIVAIVVRKCTHIAIFQSRQEEYIGFHAVLCQNDELLLEKPFREDVGDIELRLATDSEKQQLFAALEKKGKAWDSERKMIVDLPKNCEFNPFDKVLVRQLETEEWRANIFSHTDKTDEYLDYVCVNGRWEFCIPYIGNESFLGTTKDVEG